MDFFIYLFILFIKVGIFNIYINKNISKKNNYFGLLIFLECFNILLIFICYSVIILR